MPAAFLEDGLLDLEGVLPLLTVAWMYEWTVLNGMIEA